MPLQLAIIFDEASAKRQEIKLLKDGIKSSLEHNPRYQQIVEQLKVLKEEKKSIENQTVASDFSQDAQKLDLLTLDLKADHEKLSEVALSMYVKGKNIEIKDKHGVVWVPEFKVKFKKSDVVEEQPANKKSL